MVGQLGTSQDTDQLRQKLHEIQHYTHTLSQTTMESLKSLANLPAPSDSADQVSVSQSLGWNGGGAVLNANSFQRQWKLQRERLTNDFSVVLNNFQSVQRSAAAKEKASVAKARADSLVDEGGAATQAAG